MALYDLRCPSLDYVYRMTWAEFQLRLIGFNKSEERDLLKIRSLGWATHMMPRKGQRIDSWWRIGEKKKIKVSDEHKQRFLEQYKNYLDKVKHGRT